MKEKAIKALQDLAENSDKRSKISIVRELMPYIEKTMESGVTLADIHNAITERGGVDIKYITFIGSYKRIKKERKEKPAATPQKHTPKEGREALSIQQSSPRKSALPICKKPEVNLDDYLNEED